MLKNKERNMQQAVTCKTLGRDEQSDLQVV